MRDLWCQGTKKNRKGFSCTLESKGICSEIPAHPIAVMLPPSTVWLIRATVFETSYIKLLSNQTNNKKKKKNFPQTTAGEGCLWCLHRDSLTITFYPWLPYKTSISIPRLFPWIASSTHSHLFLREYEPHSTSCLTLTPPCLYLNSCYAMVVSNDMIYECTATERGFYMAAVNYT